MFFGVVAGEFLLFQGIHLAYPPAYQTWNSWIQYGGQKGLSQQFSKCSYYIKLGVNSIIWEVEMSYELLEQRIKALPVNYYQELVDFLEFLTEKVAREYKKEEDYSLQK